MAEATGLVGVLGMLMVVYYFILGRRNGMGHVLDDRGSRTNSADFGGSVAAFLEGLIAALALSELAAVGGDRGGSFTSGALIGAIAVAAVFVRQWWPGRLGVELLYSVLGLAASVPAITRLLGATGCGDGVDPSLRIVAVVLLSVIWVATLIAALTVKAMSGFRTTASGLALFGAIDVMLFMSGPIGEGLVGPAGAVVVLLAVAVIGGMSALATNLVMMTCGLMLGAIQLLTLSSTYSADCSLLAPDVPMVLLAGYAMVFWLGAWITSKVRLRRAGFSR